jgi:hypothetical protein
MSEEGKRATAFLIGHHMAIRGYETATAEERVELLGLPDRRAAFRRFARDSKSAAETKVTLQAFAAAAIGERTGAFYDRLPAVLVEAEPGGLRVAGKALARLVSAAEVLSPCYTDEEYAAIGTILTALQTPFGRLRETQGFLDVVRDPETAVRARAAGVTVKGLGEVAAVFERRITGFIADAQRAVDRYPEAAVRTALLSPLVPGFIVKEPEPAPAAPEPVVAPVEPPVVESPAAAAPAAPETSVLVEPQANVLAKLPVTAKPQAKAPTKPQAKRPRAATPKPPAAD